MIITPFSFEWFRKNEDKAEHVHLKVFLQLTWLVNLPLLSFVRMNDMEWKRRRAFLMIQKSSWSKSLPSSHSLVNIIIIRWRGIFLLLQPDSSSFCFLSTLIWQRIFQWHPFQSFFYHHWIEQDRCRENFHYLFFGVDGNEKGVTRKNLPFNCYSFSNLCIRSNGVIRGDLKKVFGDEK